MDHLYLSFFSPRDNVTSQDLMLLVDQMAENAANNPYLYKALETLKNGNYPTLLTKLEEEGEVVIPTAVTLAYVLEKMTQTMKQNWKFLKVCNHIWSQFDDISKIIEFSRVDENLFSLVKVLTIQQSIKRHIQRFETGDLRPETAINSLVVNIMEAVLEDERQEYFDNAETGLILAKYPHTKEYDNRTGSGPCQFSSNGQILLCPQPLTVHWANLYSTWNLAFVSHYPDFVYFMPKLLIPSVSNYQDNPAAYISIRVLALYTFIQWLVNWTLFKKGEKIQWSESSLTKDWGMANDISRQDYVQRLVEALSTSIEDVEAVPRPDFSLGVAEFLKDSALLPLLRRGPYNVFA